MNQLKSVILLDWFSQNKKEQNSTVRWVQVEYSHVFIVYILDGEGAPCVCYC